MRVLVPGGNGLIGSSIVSALLAAGHDVVAIGRSIDVARTRWPAVDWREHDLRNLVTADAWLPLLQGVDAVINASGILQDGPDDDVMTVQADAIIALIAGCERAGVRRFVQISAVGASPVADSVFMVSKGLADEALRRSTLEWRVLRPGLVLDANAFGGSALLRALAAMPFLIPLPETPTIRTVALTDLTAVAMAAVERRFPARQTYDVVEARPQSLEAIVLGLRQALGLRPANLMRLPNALFRALFRLGDVASWFGWRPPLNSTAFHQIENGIDGDPGPLSYISRVSIRSLPETLQSLGGSVQERWFARMFLLKPFIILTLAMTWILTGLSGLVGLDGVMDTMANSGMSSWLSGFLGAMSAIVSLALGVGVLFRRTFCYAAGGMLAFTVLLLAAATFLTPAAWLSPLASPARFFSGFMLAAVGLAIRDGR